MTTSASAPPADADELRRLLRDGFCPVGAVLPADLLGRARALGDSLLSRETDEARSALRSLGSLISVFRDPGFEELLCAPQLRSLFERLGARDVRFSAGYYICKPGPSPATFWHQDWGFWRDPISYTPDLVELGLLIYLTDVDERNGCPRFLPGSHRRRHPLHDLLAASDVAALRRAEAASDAYQGQPDAVSVPVAAGHAVLFDPRVLHGAHPNQTRADRPALVLWYFLDHAALPGPIRAFLADGDPTRGWPDEARARVAPLLPPPAPDHPKEPLVKHPDPRLR